MIFNRLELNVIPIDDVISINLKQGYSTQITSSLMKHGLTSNVAGDNRNVIFVYIGEIAYYLIQLL